MIIRWSDSEGASISIGDDPASKKHVSITLQHGEQCDKFVRINLTKDAASKLGEELIARSGNPRTRKARITQIDSIIRRVNDLVYRFELNRKSKRGQRAKKTD